VRCMKKDLDSTNPLHEDNQATSGMQMRATISSLSSIL
jgi:hypothetical protein